MVHILSPQLRMHTRKFFSLSYETSTGSGSVYMQGTDDVCFVVAWIVYFTALRALLIELLLQPLARILGVVKKSQLRFAEQGWIFLYYSTMWVLGMVCTPALVFNPTQPLTLLICIVSLGEFRVLAQPCRAMDCLASQRDVGPVQTILPHSACVFCTASSRHSHGSTPEGLC